VIFLCVCVCVCVCVSGGGGGSVEFVTGIFGQECFQIFLLEPNPKSIFTFVIKPKWYVHTNIT
jgi:hypothetical protein